VERTAEMKTRTQENGDKKGIFENGKKENGHSKDNEKHNLPQQNGKSVNYKHPKNTDEKKSFKDGYKSEENEEPSKGKKVKKVRMPIYDEEGVEYPSMGESSDSESELSDFETNIISSEEEDNLQFSTLDYTTKDYLAPLVNKKTDMNRLLKKAEHIQETLHDTSEQGKKKAEEYQWSKLMKKAQGEKVRDNPNQIAKKLKKVKKQKQKSTKEWEKRTEQTEKAKEQRQKQRQSNIQAKIDRKKSANLRKTIGAPKSKGSKGKGHKKRRPGFEGKKSGFINK